MSKPEVLRWLRNRYWRYKTDRNCYNAAKRDLGKITMGYDAFCNEVARMKNPRPAPAREKSKANESSGSDTDSDEESPPTPRPRKVPPIQIGDDSDSSDAEGPPTARRNIRLERLAAAAATSASARAADDVKVEADIPMTARAADDDGGYLYLLEQHDIKTDSRMYKIGRSVTMERPVKSYNGHRVHMITYVKGHVEAEKMLISAFKLHHKLVQGKEWFSGGFESIIRTYLGVCKLLLCRD